MSDRLLPFYSRELDALRSRAGAFAEAYPKVAGRLRLTPDAVDDPHVERLLEGVAFLTGRTQQRLDDELPEITDALLGVLYPHYLAPVPSGAIVQFACKPDGRAAVTVPRGTALLTDPVRGEPCRFRTCYDTTLWPVAIENVRLTGLPLTAPVIPAAKGARSSLRFTLRLADPEARFGDLGISELRLFLRGPGEQSLQLYELLCGHTVGVALANSPNDDRPTALPPSAVRSIGFAPEEALYPWSARSFSGFRLMTEYFALPEKFLFVDLNGLDARTLVQDGDRMEVFIYFDQDAPALERRLQPNCLALGCTPVVNLFPRRCEPIRLDHQRTEYPVIADNRFPNAFEIWRIDEVNEMRDDGSVRPWRTFYRHLSAGATGECRACDGHRHAAGAVRSAVVGGPARRHCVVGRCDLQQSRSAEPASVRRRPASAGSRGGDQRRRRYWLPDRADAVLAPGAARATKLAADLAPGAWSSVAGGGRGRGGSAARGAAPLRCARYRRYAYGDRRLAVGAHTGEHGARSGCASGQFLPRPRRDVGIRCEGLGERGIVPAGLGAGAVPGTALRRQQLRAHHRDCAGAAGRWRTLPAARRRSCAAVSAASSQPAAAGHAELVTEQSAAFRSGDVVAGPQRGSAAAADESTPPDGTRELQRQGDCSLLRTLQDAPWRFGFDAAVAVMMHAAGRGDPAAAIRFHAPPGLGFVSSDVLSVAREGDGFGATIGFSGLTGPSGVMPRPYTETVNAEQRRRSFALAAFLDLLAQGPLAQFASAGIKYRPHRTADTAAIGTGRAGPAKDGMREALLAFTGYAMPGAAQGLAIGADALLYYAGAFAAWPRSADQLAGMLSDWLGQKVEVEQFAGAWLSLGAEEQTTLPASGRPGRYHQLGVDAAIGARAWDIQSRLVLRIGPLSLAAFNASLPGGALLTQLVALTRAYLGEQTSFVVNPVLAADAVPPVRLSKADAPRLGWNGWLPTSAGRKSDAGEALFGARDAEVRQAAE
jgi:type VI secretion system ImpH/TssG family protein